MGTLGCFAILNGVSGPENVVLLSNNHVLGASNAVNGDTIYQPRNTNNAGTISLDGAQDRRNPIGKIHNVGQHGTHFLYLPLSQRDGAGLLSGLRHCQTGYLHFQLVQYQLWRIL